MHAAALLLAILATSSVLALPVDLQTEAATVDAQTVGKRSVTPKSVISSTFGTLKSRWIPPPSTIPTTFGTECSLATCGMCPTFPGCESNGKTKAAGKAPALQNWAQPPIMQERDEPTSGKALDLKKGWQQPPREEEVKREAYINPIVAGGVDVGVGPECSIHTCELCPDHPGCGGRGDVGGVPPEA